MRQGLDTAAVLHAASELADDNGFEQVTLAALAKKLNIRTPSLYNHIESLHGLQKLMALHGVQQLYEYMKTGAIGKAGEDALLSIGFQYVAFVRKHPGLYEAIMRIPNMQDPKMQEASDRIIDLLLFVLKPYKLSTDDAIHTVRGLRSIVHGFVSVELHNGFNMSYDRNESLQHILKTYIAGFARFQS